MINQLDVSVFQWLNSWAGINPLWDYLIVFRAAYLWYIVMAAAALFVVVTFFPRFREYRRHNFELFLFAFISAFTARFVIAEIIRLLYFRPRPYMALENVQVLQHQLFGNMATSGSFPSGHASLAFAVAATIYFYYPKTSILFFLAAISIGIGRVAAGVHWPSDILGGAVIGVLTAWFVRWLWLKLGAVKKDS